MNLQRVFITTIALIIIGLVLIIILQNKRLEYFMVKDNKINLTGDTLVTMDNLDYIQCGDECKKNPACIAAVIDKKKRCYLKSTIGSTITDISAATIRYPCELYSDVEFNGTGIGLDVGSYMLSDLQANGYIDKSLKSFRLRDGYKITVYERNAYGGLSATFSTSQPDLSVIVRDTKLDPPSKWSNAVSSIVISQE